MEKEFIKIITDNQGLLLKVCRMYGVRQSDAEDLFQEIVLQLWRSYPNFNSHSKVTTWMYRVALNTAISRFRKGRNAPEKQPLTALHQNLQDQHTARIDVQYDHALQHAISSLNKFDKALVLLYLDENSYQEMAEILGITETNIGVKINRIKKKLKQILNPYNHGA
ncbi:MAG: sigma-70 family RNA polymerase sigma factor [Chitinophagaceae bacterium]